MLNGTIEKERLLKNITERLKSINSTLQKIDFPETNRKMALEYVEVSKSIEEFGAQFGTSSAVCVHLEIAADLIKEVLEQRRVLIFKDKTVIKEIT